jgi:uncharacterized protein (DUF2062 family)
MSLPSINTVNDQVGVSVKTTTQSLLESQPSTEVTLKRVLAAVVAVAGALVPFLPEHTLFAKGLTVLVGLGAALGITSRGVLPK